MKWLLSLLPLVTLAHLASAEDPELALARELTNPFATLINVPINQNPDFGIGDHGGWRYTVTVQPVIPFAINKDWNIISRTVVPMIYQENVRPTLDTSTFPAKPDFNTHQSGLGDIAQSFFLSPTNANDNGWCWGVGPIFLLPSATDNLGAEQWGMGPTVGLLKRAGPWTIGALTNHIWSLGGHDGKSDVDATFLQPFIDYTTDSKTTFSVNTESTYDWTNRQWTVPIHFVVRQLFNIGGRDVSIALGARYYAETPNGGPQWGVRLGVTLLFPK